MEPSRALAACRSLAAWLAVAGCGDDAPLDLYGPACSDPPRGDPVLAFDDVTLASGVDFEYRSGDFKGGGLGVVDLDGDGLPELVAASRRGGIVVFHNLGGMRFERSTTALDEASGSSAASAIGAADLDNDGDRDLVLAGSNVVRVLANRGDGSFVQAARFDDAGSTEHVLPVDLDNDGLVDLYTSNYDALDPTRSQNRVYMNRGNMTFEAAPGSMGDGMSWTATALDADGDGDRDLYVANDTLLADFGHPPATPPRPQGPVDLFLRNDGVDAAGMPRFTDIASELGLATPRSSMSGTLADFDDDGRLDLYVTDLGAKKLFARTREGGYVDRAPELGLRATSRVHATCDPAVDAYGCLLLSWSAVLADFDRDGYDELLLTNGEVAVGDTPPLVMFARGPALPYREVAPNLPCMDARAMVATDLDGDGDVDLAIANTAGPLAIFEHRGAADPHSWATIRLRGRVSNRDGIGAIVTLHMQSGRTRMLPMAAGGVAHTASPPEIYVGLGDDTVESIDVAWPSGRSTTTSNPGTRIITIDE